MVEFVINGLVVNGIVCGAEVMRGVLGGGGVEFCPPLLIFPPP